MTIEQKKTEDFATRLGKHLMGAADIETITNPPKPDPEKVEPKKEAAAPAEETPNDEPVGSGLAIGDMVANVTKKKKDEPKEEKADDSKKEEAAKPEPVKEEPKKEEKKKVGFERREAKPEPKAEVKKEEPAPKKEEASDEKSLDEQVGVKLTDDEREYLDLVKFAQGKDERLKGALDKEIARVRAVTDFARKWRKDHPGEPIDTNDPEYKQLLADHPPTLTKGDIKRFERERIKDEVLGEAEKKITTEKRALEAKVREIEATPRVEAKLKDDANSFTEFLDSAKMKDVVEKKGIEGRVARAHRDSAMDHVRSYRRIAEGLEDYNPQNPVHQNLTRLMDSAGEYFKSNGGENGKADLVRDGKKFVTRREYADIARSNPNQLDSVWTFDHDQMVGIIIGNHAGALTREIETLRKEIAEDGYAHQSPNGSKKEEAPARKPEPVAEEIQSPKSGASPSSGGGIAPGKEAPKLSRFERHLVADPNGA